MRKIILAAALVLFGIAAFAQDFQTGYFLNGYTQSYRLNPAFRPDKNFISLPAIGGTGFSSRSNIGVENVLFPLSNGELGTFMHPDVTSAQFLGGLKDVSKVNFSNNVTLLAFGFKHGAFYHTVDVNFKTLSYAKIPYELFSFMKDGLHNETMVIPETKFGGDVFTEVAYGLNFKVGSIVSVGARIKYLAGHASTRFSIDNMTVTESDGDWRVKGKSTLRLALRDAQVETKTSSDGSSSPVIEDIDTDDIGYFAGHGMALDLGVAINIIPGLKLSASLTDIGGISWKNNIVGESSNNEWLYESGDDIEDELANLVSLETRSEETKFEMLAATARVGLETNFMPFCTLGLLGTHRFGDCPWSEARGSLNFKLFKFLGASASAAYGDFGFSWGAAADINLKIVNLYFGMDAIPSKVTPQYVPVGKANISMIAGLNITF